MANIRKVAILMLVAAFFSVGAIGCKSWRKERNEEHPSADHPEGERPKGDHPKH